MPRSAVASPQAREKVLYKKKEGVPEGLYM
jgi:hypothetical protein